MQDRTNNDSMINNDLIFLHHLGFSMLIFLPPQLLQKEKHLRLGVANDFQDIKSHPFFAPINWNHLDERKIKPPYNPNVVSRCGVFFYILVTCRLNQILLWQTAHQAGLYLECFLGFVTFTSKTFSHMFICIIDLQ